MSTFLLVHGAWGGAWCWERRLAPLLRQMGHTVFAPDLPAHGDDRTPIEEVGPTSYTDAVASMLTAQPKPVVLVGHSMGGAIISQAAELRSDKVGLLVYLAAYLAPSGHSIIDLLKRDHGSMLNGNIVLSEDRRSSRLRDEVVREALFAECADEDIEFARVRLAPEPAAPSLARLELTEARFGSIPRAYLECRRDRAVTLSLQQAMQANLPCSEVVSLDTDHSPFFSRPEELAKSLSTFGALRR